MYNCLMFQSFFVETVLHFIQVDFFWINRDQKSFEWFVSLLSQLEMEQAETGGSLGRFYLVYKKNEKDLSAIF